jgi:hypothetical protein
MDKRKSDKGGKIRLTLDVSPEFYSRLEKLEELVEAGSKAGVVRQALQLYEFVAKRMDQGYQFRAVGKGGEEETIVLLDLT